jgi:SWIM zinc finger
MSLAIQVPTPQSASLALSILQSKAGNRWARAVEEMKTKRLHVEGDFPEFVVTNKSGTGYKVRLDQHGNGTCTCPDFQVRIAQEGRICKHIAAAAITSLAPQVQPPSPGANGNGSSIRAYGSQTSEATPLIFRIRRNVQTDGKNGVQVEVQARITNDEEQDRETASYAYDLLERLASHVAKGPAPSGNHFAREVGSPSAAKPTPIRARRSTAASNGHPVSAVIAKIDRMKTRQGESLFLKVDVGGETVRVFGRPEELAERLEASGYDIPASEIQAGMELHLPCLVVTGQGTSGYKTIEQFLPEAA